MPSPFPGMDPYLENPRGFPDFHHELISLIKQALNEQLYPRYRARAEERVYIAQDERPERLLVVPDIAVKRYQPSSPREQEVGTTTLAISEPIELVTLLDEEIREAYLAIYDQHQEQVVTIIEILSPSNKIQGSAGFESYRAKRFQVQYSTTHLVEIDLLRTGVKMLDVPEVARSDYYVHVSDAQRRPKGWVWPIFLPQRLPQIRIPLGPDDEPARIDLQAIVSEAYDRSHYEADFNYQRDPVPPLPAHYLAWADELLKSQSLRPRG